MQVAPKLGALLTESLSLLSEARNSVSLPPSYRDPLTTPSIDPLVIRKQLHDELFRYFLSVSYYIGPRMPGSASPYIFGPRVAIDACTSARARAALRPPGSKTPALARPCQLDAVTAHLNELRTIVSAQAVGDALAASFGTPMQAVLGGSSSDPGLGLAVAAGLRELSTGVGMSSPVPGSTGKPFDLHITVARRCDTLVAGDLPFWPDGAQLPIADLFGRVDKVERALAYALTSPRPEEAWEKLLPWGLALTAIARAYLVDMLVALVSVSWPIGRLYWENPALSDSPIRLFSGRERGGSPAEKEAYNAYLAVALLEALRGKPMLHIDPNPGDGYLIRSPEASRIPDAVAVTDFSAIWADGGPRFHQQMSGPLGEVAQLGPIVVPPQGPKDLPGASTVDAFVSTISTPLRTFPSIIAVKPGENPNSEPAWATCARFSAHLSLYVAAALARSLGEKTGLDRIWKRIGKPPDREWHTARQPDRHYTISIGSGSLRWGGNHTGHREHRDGLTFDLFHYVDVVPWPAAKATPPGQPGQAKSYRALVVCRSLEQINNKTGLMALMMDDYPTIDKARQCIQKATDKAANELSAIRDFKDYDPRLQWADLAGLPIHRETEGDAEGQADDKALRLNLVGHVALALAGVYRWIYASPAQHLFAMRAIAMLGDSIPTEVRTQVLGAHFTFLPQDHWNHWHVVFQDFATSSDLLQQWVTTWFKLGVDPTPAIAAIKDRKLANNGIFRGVAQQQKDLVNAVEATLKQLKSKQATPPTSLADRLAHGIMQASYKEIDTETRRSKCLTRAAIPESWTVTDWEVSSEADSEGEGIDLLDLIKPEIIMPQRGSAPP